MKIASPAELLVQLAPELVDLVPWALGVSILRLAWQVPEKRKTSHEGTGQKKQNELADVERELKELEVEKKRSEAQAKAEMLSRVRAAFPEATLTDEEIDRSFQDHYLPHLQALGRAGVSKIEAGDDATASEASAGSSVETDDSSS